MRDPHRLGQLATGRMPAAHGLGRIARPAAGPVQTYTGKAERADAVCTDGLYHPDAPCQQPDAKLDLWQALPGTHLEKQAVALCQTCPIRWDCYATARANRGRHHIWGGVNFARTKPGRPPRRGAA